MPLSFCTKDEHYQTILTDARRIGLTLGTDPGIEDTLGGQTRPPGSNPVLYHYTNVEALLSILKNGQLWCTESGSLNDHAEQDIFWGMLDSFGLAVDEHLDRDKYVVSFTQNGDQLSQWRAYAQAGVAIAFRFLDLAELAKRNRYFFMKCNYNDYQMAPIPSTHRPSRPGISGLTARGVMIQDTPAGTSETVRERFLRALSPKVLPSDPDYPRIEEERQNLAIRLAHLAPAAKAAGFREENEWRLFGVEGQSADVEFAFHARPQMGLVRRALLPIAEQSPSRGWIAPVAGIVLSPKLSRDQEATRFKKNVGLYAEQHKHPGVWIEKSNIPLRDV